MLKHGGNLDAAAARYGIPKAEWLDLSTGLNPQPWQALQIIPVECFERLPYPDPAFYATASRYYGTKNLLGVPGTQSAIQALPRIMPKTTVAIPVPGYEEHLYHWQENGHAVQTYDPDTVNLLALVKQQRPHVLLVINPNNPSCKLHQRAELLTVLKEMESYNGTLIIDEAFLDTRPEHSLCGVESDALIILRSLGKFFGLPGIRVGFLIAHSKWRDKVEAHLGPWSLSGPSQWLATQCLADLPWQKQARTALIQHSQQQQELLQNTLNDTEWKASDYFMTGKMPRSQAMDMQAFFGSRGLLLRAFHFESGSSLIRFALCPKGSTYKRFVGTCKAWEVIGEKVIRARG